MGIETPFDKNDLTSDEIRYKRTQRLVRKNLQLDYGELLMHGLKL